MKLKRNIAHSDSGFVFDPNTGDSFSTNPIGTEIIKLLKEGKDTEQIKEAIVKVYLVDDATFEKDYYDFITMLSKLKLTEDAAKEKN